ncbi:MAG TPA: LuxR C-terminal-related transcriptional regulator [Gaiellaceae bacterium]|nr:LuxR C-terminal-related transcriptional regulator [Gaiellaceae bacterium]
MPAAKLAPPALPARLVRRQRLHEQLDRGAAGLVTLVSAHAGTGKTVLLSSWAMAPEGRRVAWLGLDRDDNWSPRFWLGVEHALAHAGALDGDPAENDVAPTGTHIAERLDGLAQPVVLVLDDFHEIESPIVRRELQLLLDRSPSGLRLVLSTRADPRLRLQRLRLTDDLTELRAAELAFTVDECGEALAPFADDLADGDVEALRDRTEGWAAGIRLAALSLASEADRGGFLRRFAGDDRAVADYLLNEILDRQPDRLREFLLRTSVSDTLSPELADALTGRRDGGRVLAELTAANFLVSGHVGSEVSYRYHGLLLEFLRAQLQRTRPHDLGVLQRLSARWHWTQHEPIPAFRDALAGGDWDLADEISADAWHVVAFKRAGAEHDALVELPAGAIVDRPCLGLLGALAALARGERREAERRLSASPPSGAPGGSVLRLQLEAALARLDGDYELLERVASELAEAPVGNGFDATTRAAAQSACALAYLGTAKAARGELTEADALLGAALELSRRAGLRAMAASALGELALLEAGRGRLRRAVELAAEAADDAEPGGLSVGAPLVGAYLALGWAHFQWDDLAAAGRHLDRAAAEASAVGDRTGRLASAALSALVRGAQGPREAAAALVELRGRTMDLDAWRPPDVLAPILETAEARLLAARGDVEAARAALEEKVSRNGDSAAIALLRARLALAAGEPHDALGTLELWPVEELSHLGLQIESYVLTAVARHALHDDRGAGDALEQALALAGPNSHRRPFLDCGSAVQVLLEQRVRWGTSHRSFAGELLAAFRKRAPSVAVTRAELLEPLSRREQSVLRFLPTMMSNAEIAGELFVTSNTVKTHLKSIYRKLAVSRRRDAVERARELELL